MADDTLPIYTVYQNPADYPGRIVVRRFEVSPDGLRPVAPPVAVVGTLDEARAAIRRVHPCPVCLTRADGDEPQIVENWI